MSDNSIVVPRKYNLSYALNGDIAYNGKTVGNILFSNLLDVGEDTWLENWAKKNGVEISPTDSWLSYQGKQTTTAGKNYPMSTSPGKLDPSEASLTQSFNISSQNRNSKKMGDLALNGLKTMSVLHNNLQGLDKIKKWQKDTQKYGNEGGFESSAINPFFTK